LHSVATVCHPFNIYAISCVTLPICCEDRHHKLVTRFDVV